MWARTSSVNICMTILYRQVQISRIIPSSMTDRVSSRSTGTAPNCNFGHRAGPAKNDSQSPEDTAAQVARQIFNKAVASVLPHRMIKKHLLYDQVSNTLVIEGQSYHLRHNVHMVGFGKAVLGMARAVEDVIGQHIVRGVVSVPVGAEQALRDNGKLDMIPVPESKVTVIEGAANNLPDAQAYEAAMQIKDVAKSVGKEDILLVLISGGGSALLPTPQEPISLSDIMQVSKEMAKAGADIKQLNYMRKQLEVLKGGGLAQLAFPATVIALILSDVVGDPLDFIASGPTVPDTTTPEGCLALFSHLQIDSIVPKSVVDFLKLRQGVTGCQDSEDSAIWANVHNIIIGSNALACESASEMSKNLGCLPYILSTELQGEARTIGCGFAILALYISTCFNPSLCKTDLKSLRSELIEKYSFKSHQLNEITNLISAGNNDKKSIAVIAGGETTVTVKGYGKGGRNQEMTVAAALELDSRFSESFKVMEHNSATSTTGEKENGGKNLNPMTRLVSVVFLSGGTDGQDGPTSAAGGVISLDFVQRANQSGLDVLQYLDNNDSYSLLKALDGGRNLLETGLTGTNVMDIHIMVVREV